MVGKEEFLRAWKLSIPRFSELFADRNKAVGLKPPPLHHF
jgi:hypothetical protein